MEWKTTLVTHCGHSCSTTLCLGCCRTISLLFVSPHIQYVRDYLRCKGFQSQAWQIFCSFCQCSILGWPRIPPPQSELLIEDLGNPGMKLPRITPKNEKLARSWDFEFYLPKNAPHPMKSWPEVGTLSFWVLLTQEYPPPNPMKSWPEVGTLSFEYSPNEKLARSWEFEFWVPPKMKSWLEVGTF